MIDRVRAISFTARFAHALVRFLAVVLASAVVLRLGEETGVWETRDYDRLLSS